MDVLKKLPEQNPGEVTLRGTTLKTLLVILSGPFQMRPSRYF